MEVAIRFSSVAYISGETIEEIKDKWENMGIFDQNCFNGTATIDYGEVDSVESTEDGEDLTDEFFELEN